MKTTTIIILALGLAGLTMGQQPNRPEAALRIDGNSGPSFPMDINLRTGTTASIEVAGAPNSVFALFLGATGSLQPAAAFAFGGLVDIPVSPFPTALANGFVNPPSANTGPSGLFQASVSVPAASAAGAPPLGTSFAIQGLVADPTSPFGASLTAATRATIAQGVVVQNLNFIISGGNPIGSGNVVLQQALPSGFSLPFYGSSYSTVFISENGLVSLGQTTTSYTSTPLELNTGAPRICGFWTDLDATSGSVRTTLDVAPATGVPYYLIEYINVPDFPGIGAHSFSIYMEDNGYIEIRHPASNGASIYETIVGISPGNSASTAAMKDLSTIVGGGGGAGGQNESFFEWFGDPSMIFYTPGVSRPFDLAGTTLKFLPIGSGGVPGSTDSYFLF